MSKVQSQINIEKWLGKRWKCRCGRIHFIPTKRIVIEKSVLQRVEQILKDIFPYKKNVAVVFDRNTQRVAGQEIIKRLKIAGYKIKEVCLPAGPGGKVIPDERNINLVKKKISSSDNFALAVGSGTINDICKLACTEMKLPYAVFPTASSMNGYTSNIAAVFQQGLKVTAPAVPPLAVICDLDVLQNAPIEMIRAGLGDFISKPVACADWKLASLVKGEYYCPVPLEMLGKTEKECLKMASGIGKREPTALAFLIKALLLSGFAMTVAGSSAPASGGEHLISHFWDMEGYYQGKKTALHGLQVGVATLLTARLYQRLQDWNIFPLTDVSRQRREKIKEIIKNYPAWAEKKKEILANFKGKVAGEVLREARSKYMSKEKKLKELQEIISHWEKIRQELKPILKNIGQIKTILQAAGAPTTVSQIGLSQKRMQKALENASDIRRRYTVLDLAGDLGVLN